MWTKKEVTLGDGVQMVCGRMQRVEAQVVPCYTYTCDKCSSTTSVFVTNPKAPIRAWCCGKWHTPEPELLPKPGLLTRLLS
jgi:hypothetical protein